MAGVVDCLPTAEEEIVWNRIAEYPFVCVFSLLPITHTSHSEERSTQTMGARAYEMWELKEPRRCEWRRWRSLHKAAKFCRDPARFFPLRPDWGL